MKYLTIQIDSFKIKGTEDDEEQLKQDIYERVSAMIESEVLSYSILEDEDSDEDYD